MNHFRGAVRGDGEDPTVLWGDAEVGDGSRMALQQARWLPDEENREGGGYLLSSTPGNFA